MVRHRIVAPVLAGSTPVGHPIQERSSIMAMVPVLSDAAENLIDLKSSYKSLKNLCHNLRKENSELKKKLKKSLKKK